MYESTPPRDSRPRPDSVGADVEIVELVQVAYDVRDVPVVKPRHVYVNGVDVGLLRSHDGVDVDLGIHNEVDPTVVTLRLMPRTVSIRAVAVDDEPDDEPDGEQPCDQVVEQAGPNDSRASYLPTFGGQKLAYAFGDSPAARELGGEVEVSFGCPACACSMRALAGFDARGPYITVEKVTHR